MSVHDDPSSLQRSLDDLSRSVARAEQQLGGGGLEIPPRPHRRRPSARELRAAAGGGGRTDAPSVRTSSRSPTRRTTARCGRTRTTRASAPTTAAPLNPTRPTGVNPVALARNLQPPNPIPEAAASAPTRGRRHPRPAPAHRPLVARHPPPPPRACSPITVYSTWRAAAAQRGHYAAPYVSPFYSPHRRRTASRCARTQLEIFGTRWWGISRDHRILIFPLGSASPNYYYRKAYYRGFWASRPAAARWPSHKVHRRDPLPAHHAAEHPPVLLLCDSSWSRHPYLRHRVLAFRDEHYDWGPHGPGHPCVPGQHRADLGVHPLLPSCRTSSARKAQHFSRHPVRYRMWVRSSSPPHAVGWASLVSVALATTST